MAAARNATLDFRTGDFLRASFKAVIIVAIVWWCVLIGAYGRTHLDLRKFARQEYVYWR